MTTNRKQYLSVFALSAAALFIGGCKKTPTDPDPDPKNPETTGAVVEQDSAAVDSGGAVASGDENVKCFGINSCKGESVCAVNKPEKGIEHSCAGENACAAKGWIKVTRSECEGKNGEVLGTL
jgi:hypothetical protein